MLVQLTVGQLRDIITDFVQQIIATSLKANNDPYGEVEHGLANFASYLGCTPQWASRLINEGKYNEALARPKGSRKIIFFPAVLKRLLVEEAQNR